MAPRFNYQARSAEQMQKRASGNTYEGFIKDAYETYTPKKENWIRILPPTWEHPQHYGMDIFVHYGVGPQQASVLCLWKMAGQACPVCEAHARAEAAGRADANDLKPTKRVLVWLIDRNFEKEKNQKKCFAWAMPSVKVDTEIAILCKDRETGQLFYIDNPDNGYDVFFNKEGDKMHTDYKGFSLSRRESAVDDFYLDFIMKNPIPNVLNWRTYEQVRTLFEGQPLGAVQTATPAGGVAEVTPPVSTPPPFVPEWTGTHCSICNQPQFTTPTSITCGGGHENAESHEEIAARTAPPPPQPVAPPTPPPQPVAVAPQPTPQPPQPPAAPVPSAPVIHHQPVVVTPPATPLQPPATPAVPAQAPADRLAGLRSRFKTGA